jgi:hypothetical protein
MGLIAGALILWDEHGDIIAKAIVAENEEDKVILIDLESSLLSSLRSTHNVNSAYMELGGDTPKSVCTLPIPMEEFDKKITGIWNEAVSQLGRALNHYINNPLTVVRGQPQLILKDHPKLPDDIQDKLKSIEESTKEIMDVTKRAMSASEYPSVVYHGPDKMVGLFADKKKETPGRHFGAFIGVKMGTGPLHGHDEFLKSLVSVLALAAAPEVVKKKFDAQEKPKEGKGKKDENGEA